MAKLFQAKKLVLITIFALLACFLLAMPATAQAEESATTVKVNRLYNPYNGAHLYTTDNNERNYLVGIGWNYEGLAWSAYSTTTQTPVYRLYNRYNGEHHYTIDANEKDKLSSIGWDYEGIAWYSETKDKGVAIYRQFNPYETVGTHNYTTSKSENDYLASIGWRAEGIAWYGAQTQDEAVARPSTTGALEVRGSKLTSKKTGETVQLKGVSTHGLAWFPQYVNQTFFNELNSSWNANVVRLALYTSEYNGYCTGGNQSELLDLIDRGIKAAAAADMYVIIDWHVLNDQSPLVYKDQALQFFKTVAAKYASYNNVIYEICNEPNGYATWDNVKSYANEVIPAIRSIDSDAVILVGTTTWSQDVDKAAASPLNYDNIMYSLHFYAATHKDDLRSKLRDAVASGLPVFVSEYGICDASGNGAIDKASANSWVSLMDGLDVSYVCWNLSNKNESSALFKSSCNKTSGFTLADLSEEGLWLWDILH